jgi:uncharacterized phage protein (TIGR01671 family)
MTQPTKFRVYEHKTKTWRYDFFLQSDGVVRDALGVLEPQNHTVVLFTGLHDKNGKEIWEGDMVRYKGSEAGLLLDAQVAFIDGCFVATVPAEWKTQSDIYAQLPLSTPVALEVIGNIYENPELTTNAS